MPLTPGSTFGAFDVVALVGAGGMGEVYRARDRRLNRDVALKIVRDAFVHDPDRAARFQREAQLLASLNHPNIGAIHGLEEADGLTALVLEFVEGPTLADRIARGPMPCAEALGVAGQIADALDAAHERGIVHRDLKPGNIKLRPDGTVKVLDFGLAKAVDAAGSGMAAAGAMSHSPTLTTPAMTGAGFILGTAVYMSPEQTRGQAVDKRADIWAFGCVLYEMLSAKPPFAGSNVSDVIAAILRGEPDWSLLPPDASSVVSVIRRCLEKDVRKRVRDIGDVKLLLEEAPAAPSAAAADALAAKKRGVPLGVMAVVALAAAAIAGGAVAWIEQARVPASDARVQRFQLASPEESPLAAEAYGANVAISPDGSRIVYTATRGGIGMLATRQFDRLDAEAIPGSEGGFDPKFSPDGQHILFATFKELKTVETGGGPSVTVCPVDVYFSGASWGADNTILFTQAVLGLFKVPASGGTPENLAIPDAATQERGFFRPVGLPGGAVLYTSVMADGSQRIMARRAGSKESTTIVRDGFDAHYLKPGLLVYGQGVRLMATRFNPSTLETGSAAVAVLDGVYTKLPDGIANVSIASDGTAVFVAGHPAGTPGGLVWLDPGGARGGPVFAQQFEYPRNLRLSPDGRRLALTIGPPGNGQLWVYTLDGSSQPLKLTFHDHNLFPVWSPNGGRIAFMTRVKGVSHLVVIATDGSEVEPKTLTEADEEAVPWSWSRDESSLLVGKNPSKLWLLHLAEKKAEPWLKTPFAEGSGAFSPDGHWIAYSMNQTGAEEIRVRPFPGPGAPVRVSSGGGYRPMWKSDSKEINFESHGKVFAARVVSQVPEFRADTPHVVLDGGFSYDDTDPNVRYIDLAPDGRFVAVEAPKTSAAASLVVVQHWDQELTRLVSR